MRSQRRSLVSCWISYLTSHPILMAWRQSSKETASSPEAGLPPSIVLSPAHVQWCSPAVSRPSWSNCQRFLSLSSATTAHGDSSHHSSQLVAHHLGTCNHFRLSKLKKQNSQLQEEVKRRLKIMRNKALKTSRAAATALRDGGVQWISFQAAVKTNS